MNNLGKLLSSLDEDIKKFKDLDIEYTKTYQSLVLDAVL